MLANDYKGFLETENLEKLSDEDLKRYPVMNGFTTTRNLSVPSFVDIRERDDNILPFKRITTKASTDSIDDLFGTANDKVTQLFFAYALYVEPQLGLYSHSEFTPGVYGSQIITFSTSMEGLNASLATYYKFKKTTPSAIHNFKQMKIVISHITFPAGIIDTAPPSSNSYTWKSNVAMKQIRHIVTHIIATISAHTLKSDIARYKALCEKSVDLIINGGDEDDSLILFMDAEERIETAEHELSYIDQSRIGEVRWQGLYHPKMDSTEDVVQFDLEGVAKTVATTTPKKSKNLEFDVVPKACVICSI